MRLPCIIITAATAMIASLSLTPSARAQTTEPVVTLHIGDPAPALTPGKWLKGEPVGKFENGKIYVVEFWATYFGPCRGSMRLLTKLQQRFKDVIIIGQDCGEDSQAGVPDFVREMGDRMNYRVALDNMSANDGGRMLATWFTAAGQKGIPAAFVIDKQGRIAWIGDPLDNLKGVLQQVCDGTFDPVEEAAEQEAEAKVYDVLFGKKDKAAGWELARKLADELKEHASAQNLLAWSMVDPDHPATHADLELAEMFAERCVQASEGEVAMYLDTLARVHFLKGELDKALEAQTKAVERDAAQSKRLRDELQARLEQYQAAKAKGPSTPQSR